MGDYKKLEVWKLACEFADKVERMVQTLPPSTRRRAMEQLVPAAHAIHQNLAEGCGFDSDPQLLKYTSQSLATANESEDELLALERQGLLGEFAELLDDIRRICAMLAKLRCRLEIDIARQRGRRRTPRRRAESRGESRGESRQPRAEPKSEKPKAERKPSRAEKRKAETDSG